MGIYILYTSRVYIYPTPPLVLHLYTRRFRRMDAEKLTLSNLKDMLRKYGDGSIFKIAELSENKQLP